MKEKLDVNLDAYFNWLAKWSEKSIKHVKNMENPFTLYDEWLNIVSFKVCPDLIGKEVYFSINGEMKDRITLDTYYEGVILRNGIVEEINKDNIIIKGIVYSYTHLDSTGYFYSSKDLLLSALHYDGVNIYSGNIIKDGYSNNLVKDETS